MIGQQTPGPLVTARDLTRNCGGVLAIDSASLDIRRGRILGVVGPQGAGKSTLVRTLAGLVAPTSGGATGFDGLDLVRDLSRWKARIGYMSQRCSLYEDLTVADNLRFFGALQCIPTSRLAERMDDVAARLHILPLLTSVTSTLRVAERQRVALAAAVLHGPDLLLLDEPTAELDLRARRAFWEDLYELAASCAATVLLTTGHLDEAEQCDRIAFMLHGRLVAEGVPADLKRRLSDRIFDINPRCHPAAALDEARRSADFEDAYVYGSHLRVVAVPGAAVRVTEATARIGECGPATPSLEDVFVSLAREPAGLASAGAAATARV